MTPTVQTPTAQTLTVQTLIVQTLTAQTSSAVQGTRTRDRGGSAVPTRPRRSLGAIGGVRQAETSPA